MKVLDLRCANDHRFEGWFGSDEDFQSQCERALIECPLCSNKTVTRLPSAPRLNVSGAREAPASSRAAEKKPAEQGSGAAATREGGSGSSAVAQANAHIEQMQAQWMKAVKHAIANTEDVGDSFADEARRMHYGEAKERGIRGVASREEARSLREEGIDVMPLPIPAALKGPLQ
jgi:hypothetical protein